MSNSKHQKRTSTKPKRNKQTPLKRHDARKAEIRAMKPSRGNWRDYNNFRLGIEEEDVILASDYEY